MATVVFLHAHPDDEAIFTGGTMRLLANQGHRVVLLLATAGEQGLAVEGDLGHHRREETLEAAATLGVADVLYLGYEDSGRDGGNGAGFSHINTATAAQRADDVLSGDGISVDALVGYDPGGIYDHPDHLAVHRLGTVLAARLGVATIYEATVDREYLHFVESHLVVEAGLDERPQDLGLASTSLGLPTLLIDVELDITAAADVKRAAMAAHQSQIPETSSAMLLEAGAFEAVYGYEWYVRHGAPGPIDSLLSTR